MKGTMQQAAEYLSTHDPILAHTIKKAGVCTITPHKNYYWELVDSIISQQLSVQTAKTIEGRFLALFPGALPLPEQILATDHAALRAVGLSNAKAHYIRDLAQHIVDGRLELEKLDSMPDHAIITELTAVKGIGEWTAHMFMMFAMGRPDILATGDLGIKGGIQKLYGFDHLPTPDEVTALAHKNHWSPWQTAACWYIWQAKDI